MALNETKKDIFKAMQAIEFAFAHRLNDKDAIRIDSRTPNEMQYLAKYEFQQSIEELARLNAITVEQKPGLGAHPTQRHFQLRKKPAFQKLFLKLQKEYPDMSNVPLLELLEPKVTCDGLSFEPKTGKLRYGKIQAKMVPYSAPWSTLSVLLLTKNQPVRREKMRSAIISGWQRGSGKRRGKSGRSIEIEKEVRNIRRKLKMGRVTDSENKDLIEGGSDGTTYRIICP